MKSIACGQLCVVPCTVELLLELYAVRPHTVDETDQLLLLPAIYPCEVFEVFKLIRIALESTLGT